MNAALKSLHDHAVADLSLGFREDPVRDTVCDPAVTVCDPAVTVCDPAVTARYPRRDRL